MADVYEQNLASKSTLTTTDYIRVVGSDNVSYKQLVSDVAKKIIENYTGSTLAGSAQSVKSAVDSLNSKYVVETKSLGTQTIGGGARGVFNANIGKSGYVLIGIVGIALSNNYMAIGSYTVESNTNAQVVLHNISSSSAEQTVTIRALYMQS